MKRRELLGCVAAATLIPSEAASSVADVPVPTPDTARLQSQRERALRMVADYVGTARVVDYGLQRGRREVTTHDDQHKIWEVTDGVTITIRINGGASSQEHGTLEHYQWVLEQERRGERESLSPAVKRLLEDRVEELSLLTPDERVRCEQSIWAKA